MCLYRSFSPDVQVFGSVAQAFLKCSNYHNIAPLLMRHGLLGRHGFQTVDKQQWYLQQDWLQILSDIVEEYPNTASADLLSIGMKMLETIMDPALLDTLTLETFLLFWPEMYKETHRGTDPGDVTVDIVGEGEYRIVTRVPYPDEIHYGLFYAALLRYCSEDKDFVVEYQPLDINQSPNSTLTTFEISLFTREAQPLSRTVAELKHLQSDLLFLELPIAINEAIIKNKSLSDFDVVFRVNGQSIKASIDLKPSFGSSYQTSGSVVILHSKTPGQDVSQQSAATPHTYVTAESLATTTSILRPVLRQAQAATKAAAPVLILGESGVGKGYLAHAIHMDSNRSKEPFVEINCRSIPDEHMVREILGGRGAHGQWQPSKFELVGAGTLLINSIEVLPVQLQEVVLTAIELGHVIRPGVSHPVPINSRIIATTSEDLESLIANGSFIPQLYYRFGVFKLRLPPLKDRSEDIPLLANRLLERIARKYGNPVAKKLSSEAIELLMDYPWPGNIRELETVLEYAHIQQANDQLQPPDFSDLLNRRIVVMRDSPQPRPVLSTEEAEQEAIMRAGWACEGRVTDMADVLGIGRTTLWRKMKQMNLSADYFKQ